MHRSLISSFMSDSLEEKQSDQNSDTTPPTSPSPLPAQGGPLSKHVHWRPRCLPASLRQQHTTHLIHGKKGRITILINHQPLPHRRPSGSWTNILSTNKTSGTWCLLARHPAGPHWRLAPGRPRANTGPGDLAH